mmetsp:Transcript_31107/g.75202  ORF Transcript_31107/g.75202 Transcript_31107/m.75202 type:complete len:242 (-) Transcript_31107:153-878(-)
MMLELFFRFFQISLAECQFDILPYERSPRHRIALGVMVRPGLIEQKAVDPVPPPRLDVMVLLGTVALIALLLRRAVIGTNGPRARLTGLALGLLPLTVLRVPSEGESAGYRDAHVPIGRDRIDVGGGSVDQRPRTERSKRLGSNVAMVQFNRVGVQGVAQRYVSRVARAFGCEQNCGRDDEERDHEYYGAGSAEPSLVVRAFLVVRPTLSDGGHRSHVMRHPFGLLLCCDSLRFIKIGSRR